MKLEELQALLREMGVVGAGGAGFPSYAKLSSKADTVILNCAECEPLLKVHRQVIEEYPFEVLSALSAVLEATGAERGIIAIKAHYRSAVEAIEAELSAFPKITLHKLAAVYPAGDEIILIKEVTGKLVAPGQLPLSVGVTVCNVESMYNIYHALDGKPVTDKYVTVAGEVAHPVTLLVPLGTKISELIAAAGGATCEEYELISGGPMMGRRISAAEPVTKTTNAILVLPGDHNVVKNKLRNPKINLRRTMSVCCQCRSCTDLCSRNVLGYPVEPHLVMRVLSNGGRGDVEALKGSLFCSGCGLCETYSCPQGLSPKLMIDQMKAAARSKGLKLPTDVAVDPNRRDADLKKVSVERLTMRLGLKKYDVTAPICEEFETNRVKLMLSQSIGAPAEALVAKGDVVTRGTVIAKAKDGALSVALHASIDGVVENVTERYIQIKKVK